MNQQSVPGSSRSQHVEHHIRQAGHSKTQTTTTPRNRLRTHGTTHWEPNSEDFVYTTAQGDRQPNTRRRAQAADRTTNQHQNGPGDYTNNMRLRKRQLQRRRINGGQADDKAAYRNRRQQNCCSNNNPTINRAHASWPTPNQPGMQGLRTMVRHARR